MKGWKTIAFSVGLIVLGAAQSIVEVIPMEQETNGVVLMVIGAITAALRAVTTTAIGQDS